MEKMKITTMEKIKITTMEKIKITTDDSPKYIYIGDIKETQGKRCDCYYAREDKNGWRVLFNISSDDYANAASWLSQKIKNNTDENGFKNVWLVTGDAIGVCYGGYQLANIVPIKNLSEQMEFC